ncbi:MAG TPA: class II aldolase/adducin family protein [Candidatus Acidoferrales bacterium]|nr:class II aldolase/adducin family protein [Candidatus Acidoferrales bacterium]
MAWNLATSSDFEQSNTESDSRREICAVGRWMYERSFVVASQGNLSVRLSADRILMTPSGACKGRLSPEDLLVTDLGGAVIRGSGRPSSEMQMHLLYYRSRPDVHAICHAHPPTATGFAASGRALDQAVLPEVVVCLGKIPLAPYGTPGTRELCAGLEPLVPFHDAILLENHGVVTCGENLATAYSRLELVEQFARIMLTAECVGGPRLLPRAEVQKLIAARSRYGLSCPSDTSGPPLAAESRGEIVTLTRQELESFLEETVAKDRARRSPEHARSA